MPGLLFANISSGLMTKKLFYWPPTYVWVNSCGCFSTVDTHVLVVAFQHTPILLQLGNNLHSLTHLSIVGPHSGCRCLGGFPYRSSSFLVTLSVSTKSCRHILGKKLLQSRAQVRLPFFRYVWIYIWNVFLFFSSFWEMWWDRKNSAILLLFPVSAAWGLQGVSWVERRPPAASD